ncbi:MAG: helix-turn-helix domain-containing protein [Alphaproteobacteria bacterium]|nr:helix-turn-helix domain-containing protein [Alphaproteobacteria bacterium]
MSMQVIHNAEEQLTARVGSAVRAARRQASLPRHALAEAAGISERYIGQLETGRANISLNVLQKIAAALGLEITDLLEQEPVRYAPLSGLLSGLSEQQLRDAHAVLARHFEAERQAKCGVALVGLRGAGKTALGRSLAGRLGVPFVQLTELVTERAGMTTQELVELAGLDAFRRLEREALVALVEQKEKVVLETSGGLVGAPETYRLVLEHFHTVWVKALPEEHMQRVVDQNDLRPMAGRPGAMNDLKALLADRQQAYGQAAAVLDTSGRDEDSTADQLFQLVAQDFRAD